MTNPDSSQSGSAIYDVVIERAAKAILHAEHPEACGWSGKPEETKAHYRRLAMAALKSAQPEDEEHVGAELSRLEDDFFAVFGALGYDRIPGEHEEAAQAFGNVVKAARQLDEHFGGEPDRWTLNDWVINDAAVEEALLSLHDYLNDVERYRPR